MRMSERWQNIFSKVISHNAGICAVSMAQILVLNFRTTNFVLFQYCTQKKHAENLQA